MVQALGLRAADFFARVFWATFAAKVQRAAFHYQTSVHQRDWEEICLLTTACLHRGTIADCVQRHLPYTNGEPLAPYPDGSKHTARWSTPEPQRLDVSNVYPGPVTELPASGVHPW
ncbi:hypothetical protein GCM10010329_80410 [Streptomyces spiroverticillatus]|uniref:Uncharacterized protein n=1 Tax=Streptomyces finlayi TaxID=67296 RepID=A0A918X715_9ACTN|nr:hypothetical protein [Streptomyces finlayi]GHA45806.1 hypothetical protein GCM10010329_80410 [Streptomyces spiroverticillatus]GHD15866.1 hypothetical protein GCM10010334_76330 [Streptomyces finlayi]